MVAFPPVPIGLVIAQFFCFGLAVYLMTRVYFRHRFFSHLLLAFAFGSMLLSGILRFLTNFSENETTVEYSWQVQNVFLILGLILVFWAFTYFQHRSFPFYVNFVSLWGGATVLIFALPEFIKMEYDDLFGWNASYDPLILIFTIPMIIFFIVAFIRPIIVKIKTSSDPMTKKTDVLIVISYLFSVLWAFLSAFTVFPTIRVLRTFLLPLGWLLWALVTWKNPLVLIFTDARMEKLLIVSNAGLPVFFYDFEKKTQAIEDTAILSGILTASTSAITEAISPGKTTSALRSIRYRDQYVMVRHIEKKYLFFGFSRADDPCLTSAFNVFTHEFRARYGEFLRRPEIVEWNEFQSAVELVEEIFAQVHLLKSNPPA